MAPAAPESRRLRLCLAGSGGGHVRQLLDLEPVWTKHDAFFVTEDTALGRSLATKHRVRFVGHYAVGQARLGSPFRMLRGAIVNLFQSIRIVWGERPDVVISTGAGAMFWTVLLARLLGARFVLIESFARFDAPSKFARIAAPLAHRKIVQSRALDGYWPDARVFDPLRRLDGPRPVKKPLLFATVGATLPFPRLVESVTRLKAAGAIPEEIVLQIGDAVPPAPIEGVRVVASLDFAEVQVLLGEADLVICHGGTGSIITALREGCRVIAMPRRFDLGEHYDDHQEEITEAFATRGLIETVRDEADLGPAIARAKAREPVMATTDPAALTAYLDDLLAKWVHG